MSSTNEIAKKMGYTFNDPTLLEQALTHPSCKSESEHIQHNQRLEFLGDAVLGLIIGEALYKSYPESNEGRLTSMRSQLVRESSIAKIAQELGFGKALHMSRGETRNGGGENPSILADTFESVLGAVYLDGGMQAAREYCLRLIPVGQCGTPEFESTCDNVVTYNTDSKTLLQERTQARFRMTPSYKIVHEKGPPHKPIFEAEVWCGSNYLATGFGSTKKNAHKDAARKALETLE